MRSERLGFSLIELMVVLVVAGIVLAIGVPSFNSQVKNSRLTSAINQVVAAMHLSRSEASKRRIPVVMCTSSNSLEGDGASCDGIASWKDGWLVFADLNSNDTFDGADEIINRQGPQSDGLNVGASAELDDSITYLPSGFAKLPLNMTAGRYIVYCAKPEDNRYTRVLSVSNSGRPNIIPWDDAVGAPACTIEN